MGRVRKSQESKKKFEEQIEEIDRDLKNFDKDEVQQLDIDMVTLLGEVSSSEHPKQFGLEQKKEEGKDFTFGQQHRSFLGRELSGQPSMHAADLVSFLITQTILGDITNILGRLDKTGMVESKKRKKENY